MSLDAKRRPEQRKYNFFLVSGLFTLLYLFAAWLIWILIGKTIFGN